MDHIKIVKEVKSDREVKNVIDQRLAEFSSFSKKSDEEME